ncbi:MULTISPECIES: Rv3235 family protein [unclassified Nocardia]|uniref:Rv3235 family protein n=1 Tax=unclassified Nocardia TaxID=2637762 RepID=UPI001CE3D57E|nr:MULTISPECIES: Rv3235 family protein [unclassified Nocardia]
MSEQVPALRLAPLSEPPAVEYRVAPRYPARPAAVRQCHGRPPGSRREPAAAPATDADDTADTSMKSFVDQALRLVLEVLDHRRPVRHLALVADVSVVSAIQTLVRMELVPGRQLGIAILYRAGLQLVTPTAAEISASYDRGERHFALAARMERTRPTGNWRLTTVRIL